MQALEVLYDMQAKIVSRHGNGISGRIQFEAKSKQQLTQNNLEMLQLSLGYHPAGYGLFSPSIGRVADANGYYHAIWQCSTSCD